MGFYHDKQRLAVLLVLVLILSLGLAQMVFAMDIALLDSQVKISDTAGKLSGSGTSATATAKGSLTSKSSNTVTIYNESGSAAELSFDYTISSASKYTIDGSTPATSGTFSKTLDAGGSVVIVITSKNGFIDLTVTLSLTNIALKQAAAESDVTVQYDSAMGSVTMGGTAVNSGTTQSVSGTTGTQLVATPKSGYTFAGWINTATNQISSTSATYTLVPVESVTVKALFASASSNALFRVGTAYMFEDLTAACAFASASSSYKTVILAQNGTLPAGNYSVPSGVTLLIPFNAQDTVLTTDMSVSALEGSGDPTTFRTLTMADGANITVNGVLSVGGQRRETGQGPTGDPRGAHGKIMMNAGSAIDIPSGGKVYCYGFIAGSGQVTLRSGGELRELLQLFDWPGGTNAKNWFSASKTDKLFLSTRYTVQNVEAPLRVYAGGNMYCSTELYATLSFESTSQFVGSSSGLFHLGTNTYFDRTYDPATDRVTYDLQASAENSTINFGSINVSLGSVAKYILGSDSLNSSDFILGLSHAMTVRISDNVNLSMGNRVTLLPGSEVIIEEGGTVNMTSKLYIMDQDDWISSMVYSDKVSPVYTAGRGLTRKIVVGADGYMAQYDPATETKTQLPSGRLEVNGTLNVSGSGIITTTTGYTLGETSASSSSEDKIIYGTGTINISSTSTSAALTGNGQSVNFSMPTTYALAHLAGFEGMTSMSPATADKATVTYYGLGADHDNIWYETKDETPATCGADAYTVYNTTNGSGYTVIHTGTATGNHIDAADDGNHSCDVCSTESVTQCVDNDMDHTCDNDTACTVEFGVHADSDTDQDHKCDYCSEDRMNACVSGTPVEENRTDATCLEAGSYDVVTCCTICGEELSRETITLDALGHTVVTDAAVAPTCTEPGKTEGSHCSVCNEILTKQEEIAATGHSYQAVVTDPTCTEAGYTTHTCSVCSHSYKADHKDALGHTPGAEKTENSKAATCTAEGSYDTVVYCAVCNAELSRKTTVVSKLDHIPGDAATCTDPQTCTVCSTELAAALGHTNGDPVIENRIEPTVNAEGSFDTVVYCKVCNSEISRVTATIPQLYAGVFYATKIRVEDSLDIYFYIDPAKLPEGKEYKIQLVRTKGTETQAPVSIDFSTCKDYGNYRYFCYEGIAAKEMTDIVSVTVYDKDGVQISATLNESVETYALRALKAYSSDNKLRTALVDMLNYGNAAQKMWSYNTDKPAVRSLSEEQKGYASNKVEPENQTKGFPEESSYDVSATLTAKASLAFSFYFSGVPEGTAVDIEYTDHYENPRSTSGTLVKKTIDGQDYCYIDVTGLAVADGRQEIICRMKIDDQEYVLKSSVQSYIYSVVKKSTEGMTGEKLTEHENNKALSQALMNFIDSAYTYFHR